MVYTWVTAFLSLRASQTFVNVEGQRSHGDSNHGFRMVEKLDRFDVQWKVTGSLNGHRLAWDSPGVTVPR